MSDTKSGAIALPKDYAASLLGERREKIKDLWAQLQAEVAAANASFDGNPLVPLVIDKYIEEHAGGPDPDARLRVDEQGTVWFESSRVDGEQESTPGKTKGSPNAAKSGNGGDKGKAKKPPKAENDGPLPKMNELRPMAAELGLDIGHLGRARRAIWALIQEKRAEKTAESVDEASKALKEQAAEKPPEDKPEDKPKKKMIKTGDPVPAQPVGEEVNLEDLLSGDKDAPKDLKDLKKVADKVKLDPLDLPKDKKPVDLKKVTSKDKETDLKEITPEDKETDLKEVVGPDEDLNVDDILSHNG